VNTVSSAQHAVRPDPAEGQHRTRQPESAIAARGLVKTYAAGAGKKNRIKALDGLDLEVSRGTIFALVGPNGAGKTTTVKILTSLATPDEGTAEVEGIDVLTRPAEVRHVIGVVAQRSGADPTATGRENLVLTGAYTACPRRTRSGAPTNCSRTSGSKRPRSGLSGPTPAACSAASTSRSA
jgi:ABC-type uncharacterized transport system ATPase subunit